LANKKRTLILVVCFSVVTLGAVLTSLWYYASYKLSQLDSYKETVTKAVVEKLNRNITFDSGKASLSLSDGLSLQFTNLAISEKDRSSGFINIRNAYFRVRVLPLLINRVVFGEVIFEEPCVSLTRDKAGVLNIDDLLTKKEDENAPKFRKIIIKKGSVTFIDYTAGDQGLRTSLENFECRIDSTFWTKISHFDIKTSVREEKNRSELALDGFYRPAPSGKPFYESKVRSSIHLKGMNINHYGLYWKKHTPFAQMDGYVDADVTYTGQFSDFKSKGTVKVKNGLLEYHGVFRDVLQPRYIQLDYALKRDTKSIKVDVSRVVVDKFSARGSFEMDDLDKKDPLLKAYAVTPVFVLKEVKSYVPWGIIPSDVGNFIDTHIKDGNLRLLDGKLVGRLSRIADFNSKASTDVLSIEAEINKGIFEAAETAPVFHDISGLLELKKRQFSIKKIKARFGLSPLTVEGNISDFGLPHPTIYTAEMKIQPAREDVVWLLGKEKFKSFDFKGPSTLVLSGKGTDKDYHINAAWDLTDAAYAYPDVLEKPRARKNRLAAEVIINENAVTLSSLDYQLPPFNITGSMMVRFDEGIPSSFNIKSGTLDLRDVSALLPFLRKYNPAGNGLLALSGRGDLEKPGSLQWRGYMSLTNASIKPFAKIKPLKGLTGNIIFNGSSLESPVLKAQIGESGFQGYFKIDDFRNPRCICQFNSSLLKTKDLGLQSREGEVNLRDVKGQMVLDNKLIHVENLSFKLGQSGFNLFGDITDFSLPKISLVLNSPYIGSEDLSRLISLSYPKKEGEVPSSMDLDATLKVDAGKFKDIDFRKLNAGLKYSKSVVDIENLEVGAFDGKFKARGRVAIHPSGQNRYDANISISKMSLEKLQSYLELGDRTVTGKLSLTGDLYASGSNTEDLKKTATGKFQVRAEKGILKKFSGLSKTFAFLNLMQFVKLKLPDMTTQGMTYNVITSNMSLSGGVISSDDFFIDSDSIQISGSGKIDYLKKKLDLIVGIHPLQTLDFIASKIPIAGWIITDEKGKLITFNLKVEGSWDNPNVSPINTRSIGKGTLNMFRRIFQLPEKLITDTGEVIFGH